MKLIIYLSSSTERDTLKRVRETNSKGYLIKPYTPEDLKATIESVLQHHSHLTSNLKRINRKAKLATFKIKQIAHQNLNLPSLSDRDRQIKRAKYCDCLPPLFKEDAQIVSTLQQEGVCITSLPEFKLPHTKRLVKEMKVLHPHLYTLSKQSLFNYFWLYFTNFQTIFE